MMQEADLKSSLKERLTNFYGVTVEFGDPGDDAWSYKGGRETPDMLTPEQVSHPAAKALSQGAKGKSKVIITVTDFVSNQHQTTFVLRFSWQ